MKKLYVLALAAVILTFSSCDEFFSTSFGKARDFDPANIEVSSGNVDDWILKSVGNPELAAAVAEAIKEKLPSTPRNSDERAKLLDGGINLAVKSTNTGTSMIIKATGTVQKMLEDDPGEDEMKEIVKDLLGKIQDDFSSSGGPKAGETIAQMAGANLTTNNDGVPAFDPAYAAVAKPGDVANVIMVLVLAELDGKSIDNWDDTDAYGISETNGHITATDATPGATALAAYINLIVDGGKDFDDNPLTSAIREAFLEN